MLQRPLRDDQTLISPLARTSKTPSPAPASTAETLAFDKADRAEKQELQRLKLESQITALEAARGQTPEADLSVIISQIESLRSELATLDQKSPLETP
ncbi:MAG: hypothetical protein J6386_08565 [Candidatus Synoicihabitans palmerolidicus]|nr:hypothetical protein [Candidatus Synoicihabitans palmerolidicus]